MRKILMLVLVTLIMCSCSKKVECSNEPGIISQKETEYIVKNIDFKFNNDNILLEDLNSLNKYEIIVNENNIFDVYESKYIGIKLSDLMSLNKGSYVSITIKNDVDKEVSYFESKIPETSYIVFNKDGKDLTSPIIVNFDLSNNYWIYNVDEVIFYSVGV